MKMLSNTPPQRNSRELWKHFSKTYMSLGAGLIVLAFTMPFVFYLYGKFRHGLDLQPSMSAYFWTAAQDMSDKAFCIEAAGVLTFGVYRSVKTLGLKLSSLERDPEEALRHAAERQTGEAQVGKLDAR